MPQEKKSRTNTPKRNSNHFVQLIAILIIFSAAAVYLYTNVATYGDISPPSAPRVGFVEKATPISYGYNSHSGFYAFGQNFFYFYTRDGISYRNLQGEVIWEDSFDMELPEANGCGNHVAIGEIKGNQVRVYGPNGLLYSKNFDSPVASFTVNRLGALCVGLINNTEYITHVFDEKGNAIQQRNHVDANIFPITAALADNSGQLALSLLDINGVRLQTNLIFVHLNRVKSMEITDGIWGGLKKENQIIGSLRFTGNNSLMAISDLELSNYTLTDEDTVIEGEKVELNNEVKNFGYMDNKGLAIVLGHELSGKTGETENLVKFYDAQLHPTGSFQSPKNLTYLSSNPHGAIVGNSTSYFALNTKGSLLWEYNSGKELKDLFFLNNTDTILEVGFTEARILKREKLKDSPSETEVQPDAELEATPPTSDPSSNFVDETSVEFISPDPTIAPAQTESQTDIETELAPEPTPEG